MRAPEAVLRVHLGSPQAVLGVHLGSAQAVMVAQLPAQAMQGS